MRVSGMIRGNGHISKHGFECSEIRSLITRRRLQILVHSCLYYGMDTSLIPDHMFDKWSQELVQLQNDYPEIAEKCDYAKAFKDFDGSTGFDLPHHNLEIVNKARQLKQLSEQPKKVNSKKGCKKKKHVIYLKRSNKTKRKIRRN